MTPRTCCAGGSTFFTLWAIIRARFVESRRAFQEQPNLLAREIREARSRIHTATLSRVKPLLDKIDRYYNEVNVSLHVEEECLQKILSSLRVTSDDRRRWEHIRDACNEAVNLLTTEAPLPPSHIPQSIPNNKATRNTTRNINVLAQTVLEERQSLEQVRQDVTDLTQHPQMGLLRLQSEYKDNKEMCRQTIHEVLRFSEGFLRSFVEIPPLDDFRDHLLPQPPNANGQMKRNAYAVLRALPHLEAHFTRFEYCFPIAHASMQGMYSKLRGLVQPLEQPENPPQGVFRTMGFDQLRNAQLNWRELEEQWAARLRP
ncbi:hypothetical protein BGY98DRAFT_963255 [Russula aff. rugulosa BPL654]|nr:hypothetical protein BGY98DRAFT_963255 [Russula aff. rugulosa BPL654]